MGKRIEQIGRIQTDFCFDFALILNKNSKKIRLYPPNPFYPFFHSITNHLIRVTFIKIMANHQKPNFFWPGYADLMNNLFYIMLVLYVLTFVILKNEQAKYKADAEQLRQIRRIENAVNNIDTTRHYFAYDSIYQKHVLSINVQFASGQYDIHQLSDNTRDSLRKAGERIRNLILQSQKEKALEVKFLVIIEGQASRDGSPRNFPLSHERARSLLNFWKSNSIDMERLKNCELVVAGSGEGGLPRIQPDVPPANQRFLIHIIPKIGSFKKGKNMLR